MKDDGEYVLVAGNLQIGKSTTLNCLMEMRNSKPLKDDQKFQSGLTIGSGMTYQLDTKCLNGVTYMDTPGLDDTKKRKQAAEAITQALKKDGSYRIIFVVTLEAGRVRAADVTTMHLILDSTPEITRYGVIFNKLSKRVIQKLTPAAKLALVTQVSVKNPGESKEKPLPVPLFLPTLNELEDEDNVVTSIEGLEDWFRCLVPIVIHSNQVDDIPTESFDERKEQYEKQLEFYKNNLKENQRLMEENRKLFERQRQEMKEESDRRFKQQSEKMERERKEYQEELRKTETRNQQKIAAAQTIYEREMELVKQQLEGEFQRLRKQLVKQNAEAAETQRRREKELQQQFEKQMAETIRADQLRREQEIKKEFEKQTAVTREYQRRREYEIQELQKENELKLTNDFEEKINNLQSAHKNELRNVNNSLDEVNREMDSLKRERDKTIATIDNDEDPGTVTNFVGRAAGFGGAVGVAVGTAAGGPLGTVVGGTVGTVAGTVVGVVGGAIGKAFDFLT